mmetsp:Transcript_58624/g.188498  ORF Transcript_58624/g.188498 Transcript_58624/m.188498 type:complete len:206 (+) Transcript_58624:1317-1934(+)
MLHRVRAVVGGRGSRPARALARVPSRGSAIGGGCTAECAIQRANQCTRNADVHVPSVIPGLERSGPAIGLSWVDANELAVLATLRRRGAAEVATLGQRQRRRRGPPEGPCPLVQDSEGCEAAHRDPPPPAPGAPGGAEAGRRARRREQERPEEREAPARQGPQGARGGGRIQRLIRLGHCMRPLRRGAMAQSPGVSGGFPQSGGL